MRAVLIDWMTEVCFEYTLKRDTLYTAVSILERYLSSNPNIPKKYFQLAGVTSLFISSKQEESQSPCLVDFKSSCAGAYSEIQIREQEIYILKSLKWKTNVPTTLYWILYYINQWDIFVNQIKSVCINNLE
jgi:cyclin A